MKDDYLTEKPIASHGRIMWEWQFEDVIPFKHEGAFVACLGNYCKAYIENVPLFNDTCGLARWAHELKHAMGGTHE